MSDLTAGGPWLVERESELGRLTAAARSAAEGEGSLVAIRGPIGTGKSALLHAVSRLPGRRETKVLRASASALEQDYAFGVVRQLLEPVFSGSADPEGRRRLAGLSGFAEATIGREADGWAEPWAAFVRQATLLGLHSLVERMCADSPVTILVDDLQWADEPSLRWLTYLATRLSGLRVLMVVAVRDGDPRSVRPLVTEVVGAAGHNLRPEPLSAAGVRAFVRATTWGRDDGFGTALYGSVGGNPLCLTSVLLGLERAGLAPETAREELSQGQSSARICDSVIACFYELPESIGAVAGAMGVLGTAADVALISRVADVDTATGAEAMRVMRKMGIVTGQQGTDVLYPLIRDAILHTLPIEERERLRTRAATVLHAEGYPAEQIAEQLMLIASPQDAFAVTALRVAADTAQRRGAPEVAVRYLRRALLETSPQGEDRARLLVDLAMVERTLDIGAAIRHIFYAVPLLRDVRDRAAALMRIAPPMLADAPPAVRGLVTQIADEFGDRSEGADRDLGLQLEARSRHIGYTDPAELTDSLRRLSDLGAEPALETVADRELLIVLLYSSMLTAGKPAEEIARLGEHVLQREPALSTHVHTALPLLATTLATAGSVARIGPWLDLSLQHARRQGSVLEQALIRTEQAGVALRCGQNGEARTAMLEAADLAPADWISRSSSWSAITLAAVAVSTQDPRLIELADGYRDTGANRCFAGLRQWGRAAQARSRDDLPAALEQLLECGRGLERARWRNPELFPWRSEAAETAYRLGDLRTARQLAEEYRAQADRWGNPVTVGRARRVLGELSQGKESVAMLREAVAILEKSINRFELSLALTALGSRLLDSDAKTAGAYLRRARELAQEFGDRRGAALASPPGEGRPEWWSMLSKAEVRVARLAGTGLSNQEVAQRLGVSLRTIEKHLTNTYRKLGLRGKAELVETTRTATTR